MNKAKIGLVIALLICLLPMPYGYYTIVRLSVMIIFGIMALSKYEESKRGLAVLNGAIALLFQPFIPLTMDRAMWAVVDIAVALYLIIILIYEHKKRD